MLFTALLAAFVLVLATIIAVSGKVLDIIFDYVVKKTTVKEEVSNNVMVAVDDFIAELHASKVAVNGSIQTATDKEILNIQSVIEQRAFKLKRMVAVKRSLEAKQAANRAAEQEAFKLKKRMEAAEIYAQNRAALRLRELTLTV